MKQLHPVRTVAPGQVPPLSFEGDLSSLLTPPVCFCTTLPGQAVVHPRQQTRLGLQQAGYCHSVTESNVPRGRVPVSLLPVVLSSMQSPDADPTALGVPLWEGPELQQLRPCTADPLPSQGGGLHGGCQGSHRPGPSGEGTNLLHTRSLYTKGPSRFVRVKPPPFPGRGQAAVPARGHPKARHTNPRLCGPQTIMAAG